MQTKRIITLLLVFFQLGLSCFMPKYVNAGEVKTVIIDAGHGGKDPGAVGSNSREKDITLAIALKLGNYIETKLKGVKVIYTRKTDIFPSLVERTKLANENNGDLFISIHANSAPSSPSAYGTETLIMGSNHEGRNLAAIRENSVILMEENYMDNYDGFDPNAPETEIIFNLFQSQYISQSKVFATRVEDQFKNRAGRKSRGVKQQLLLVLYKTAMPGVLVETGFISNPNEQKYLKSEKGQDYIASAIFRAFRDYKSEVEGVPVSEFQVEEKEEEVVEEKVENVVVEEVVEKKEGEIKMEEIKKGEPEDVRVVEKEDLEETEVKEGQDPIAEKETESVKLVEDERVKEVATEKGEQLKQDGLDNTTASLVEEVGGNMKVTSGEIIKEPIVEKEIIAELPQLKFKVQIKSSIKTIELIPENFNGLQYISKYVDKGVNKFVYGSEDDIDAAVNLQKQARKVGFADAFVVAFVDGKRIAMSEALRMQKKD